MNDIIKQELETYVIGRIRDLNNLDHTTEGYQSDESHMVKVINTMVETLQKEDMNMNTCQVNLDRIQNEKAKAQLEYEVADKKIKLEADRTDKEFNLDTQKNEHELMKINNDYEINLQRIELETQVSQDNNELETMKAKHTISDDEQNIEIKRLELELNDKGMKGLNVERVTKVLVDTATVVVPAVIYNVWMKRGFEFEQTGAYTSNTFKNIIGKFKPTK